MLKYKDLIDEKGDFARIKSTSQLRELCKMLHYLPHKYREREKEEEKGCPLGINTQLAKETTPQPHDQSNKSQLSSVVGQRMVSQNDNNSTNNNSV